jgi:hypothetical protein
MSSPRNVLSGVIQGSVLGPLLFTIFINDIDNCVFNSGLLKYADDVKLTIAYDRNNNSRCQHRQWLQEDLGRIEFWSKCNYLPMNVSKCHFISFGSTDSSAGFRFVFDGAPFEKISCVRDLGIYISSPFSFKFHISCIVSKANRMLIIIIIIIICVYIHENENRT